VNITSGTRLGPLLTLGTYEEKSRAAPQAGAMGLPLLAKFFLLFNFFDVASLFLTRVTESEMERSC
jgi:hypothetical protein